MRDCTANYLSFLPLLDLADPRICATMFAICMMFVNIGTVGGQMLSGFLTERTGFSMMVIIMGAINLMNIFLVIGLFWRKRCVSA
jgi:hypothetical protein